MRPIQIKIDLRKLVRMLRCAYHRLSAHCQFSNSTCQGMKISYPFVHGSNCLKVLPYLIIRKDVHFQSRIHKQKMIDTGWNPELVFLSVVFSNCTNLAALIRNTSVFDTLFLPCY